MQRVMRHLTGLVAIGMVLHAGGVAAQRSSSQDNAEAGRDIYTDDLQRSTQVFTFRQAAPEGAARGQEIFYYRCWTCHNSYTSEAGSPAPTLEGLYDRPILMTSRKPVNDANVAEKISDGGPLMPGYRHTMSDADIADVVSYLKGGECCLGSGGVNLPANPRYIASEGDSMKFDYRGNLDGGPTGKVRSAGGVPLEGIMEKTAVSSKSERTSRPSYWSVPLRSRYVRRTTTSLCCWYPPNSSYWESRTLATT